MKLRVIIVDDERMARTRLRRMLEKDPEVEIAAECADGLAAVNAVRAQAPDLILLDIQMPGMDGFDVLEALGPERTPEVVFVTAYDEHAIRAFEEHALDYLMKPVSAERFAKMLARVRERRAGAAKAGIALRVAGAAQGRRARDAPGRQKRRADDVYFPRGDRLGGGGGKLCDFASWKAHAYIA